MRLPEVSSPQDGELQGQVAVREPVQVSEISGPHRREELSYAAKAFCQAVPRLHPWRSQLDTDLPELSAKRPCVLLSLCQ